MTGHMNAHLFVDARKTLERAFGQTLPTDYPDLFGYEAIPRKSPAMPDIL
jgi:hypothetical protein